MAQWMAKSDHVKVRRKRIPSELKAHVEKELKSSFDITPKVYIYEPTRGHSFTKRKNVAEGLGESFVTLDSKIVGDGAVMSIDQAYILLPRSHYKNKKVAHSVLVHELAEVLAEQKKHQPSTHEQAKVVETKYEKKQGTSRKKILKEAVSLFKDPKSWG